MLAKPALQCSATRTHTTGDALRIPATITRSFALIALLLVASPAYAQLCLGAPTFRTAPYQVGIAASFTDGARGVEGTFAGGGETVFAGAGVSVVNFTVIDVRAAGASFRVRLPRAS